MSQAATALRGAAKITLGDLRLDAKLYTQLHPHCTGFLRAESDTCSMSEYLKNRLLSLQHDFRSSTVWSFQFLDRLIKNDLYFRHQARHSRQAQMPAAAVANASCLNPSEAGGTAAAAENRKRPAPGQEPFGGSEDTPSRERDE